MSVKRCIIGMGLIAGVLLSGGVSVHGQTSSTPSTPATTASTTNAPKSTTTATTKTSAHKRSRHKRRPRGQQKMDAQRVQAIQEALVREHYMQKPTGKWDATTQAALQKYQADNGWQNKVVPDSRALIKLGLGPDNDHLLNPESAMTSSAPVTHPSDPPAADPKK